MRVIKYLLVYFLVISSSLDVHGQAAFTFQCVCDYLTEADSNCDVCDTRLQSRYFRGLLVYKDSVAYKWIEQPYIVYAQDSVLTIRELIPNAEQIRINVAQTNFYGLEQFKDSIMCPCYSSNGGSVLVAGDNISISGDTISAIAYSTIKENDVVKTQRDTVNFVLGAEIDWVIVDDPTGQETEIQADLRQQGATSGQVLKWNGSQWAPANDSIGTVGVSGHVIADDGVSVSQADTLDFTQTTSINFTATTTGGVTDVHADLQIDGVTASHIAANAVGSSEIATGAVGSDELASSGVTPGTYTNATVTVDEDGIVTSAASGSGGGTEWGDITGTLSDQTDLQTELDSKVEGSGTLNYFPVFTPDGSTLGDSPLTLNGNASFKYIGLNTGSTSVPVLPGWVGSRAGLYVLDDVGKLPFLYLRSSTTTFGGFALDASRLYFHSSGGLRFNLSYQNTGTSSDLRIIDYYSSVNNTVFFYKNNLFSVGNGAAPFSNTRFGIKGTGSTSGSYSLIATNSTGTTSTATIAARDDGKVGIGTNAPSSTLHVVGDARAEGLLISKGSGSGTGSTTASDLRLWNDGTGVIWNIESNDDDNLKIYGDGTKHLEVNNFFGTTIGRFASEKSVAPTVTYSTGAGTGASTVALLGGMNAFILTFDTGTAPTAGANIFTITLPANFPTTAVATFAAGNDQTADDYNIFVESASSANSFTFKASAGNALQASTTYSLRFTVLGY